jgi:hypothetical protein
MGYGVAECVGFCYLHINADLLIIFLLHCVGVSACQWRSYAGGFKMVENLQGEGIMTSLDIEIPSFNYNGKDSMESIDGDD